MPNKTITINPPVLQGTEYFHVRYRAVPNGTWVVVGDVYNAPFTIFIPLSGNYELEVDHFKGSDVAYYSCGKKYYQFSVPRDEECVEDVEIDMTIDVNNVITLTFTATDLVPLPPNGYIVDIYIGITLVTTLYPTQLDGLVFSFPNPFPNTIPTISWAIGVKVQNQNGNFVTKYCLDGEQTPTALPCTGYATAVASLIQNQGTFYIFIQITQSIPITTNMHLTYAQSNAVTMGVPDGGGIVVNAASPPILVQVNPNMNILGGMTIIYDVVYTDICGNKYKDTISYVIT